MNKLTWVTSTILLALIMLVGSSLPVAAASPCAVYGADSLTIAGIVYPTLDEALAAADSGNTIKVCGGPHTMDGDIVLDDLTIQGYDFLGNSPVIRTYYSSDVIGDDIVFKNLTVQLRYGSIMVDGENTSFRNSIIESSYGHLLIYHTTTFTNVNFTGQAFYPVVQIGNDKTAPTVQCQNCSTDGLSTLFGSIYLLNGSLDCDQCSLKDTVSPRSVVVAQGTVTLRDSTIWDHVFVTETGCATVTLDHTYSVIENVIDLAFGSSPTLSPGRLDYTNSWGC